MNSNPDLWFRTILTYRKCSGVEIILSRWERRHLACKREQAEYLDRLIPQTDPLLREMEEYAAELCPMRQSKEQVKERAIRAPIPDEGTCLGILDRSRTALKCVGRTGQCLVG